MKVEPVCFAARRLNLFNFCDSTQNGEDHWTCVKYYIIIIIFIICWSRVNVHRNSFCEHFLFHLQMTFYE